MPKPGVRTLADNFLKLAANVEYLTKTQVMVGVPGEKAGRRSGPITNASLAYIHEHGSPLANIPARPFLEPGIKSVRPKLEAAFKRVVETALKELSYSSVATKQSIDRQLNIVGTIARDAAKAKISEGIPPPLAPSTVAARIRRVKGKKRRDKINAAIAAGTPTSRQGGAEGIFTPLIVSGQLRNAITYVLRKR